MKRSIRITGIVILIICSLSITVFATSILDLNNKQNELQNEINEKNDQLGQVQDELTDTLQQIQKLNETIASQETEVSNLDQRIEELKISIEETEEKLSKTEQSYKIQKEAMDKRLLTIYQAGDIEYLDVLLNSNSLSEFLSNYFIYTEIMQNDVTVLEDIQRQKNEMETAKQKLQEHKKQLAVAKESKEKTSIIMQNTQKLKNNYMSQLTEEEKKIQDEIDKATEELKKVEAEIVLATTTNNDYVYSGGVLAWPTPGYTRITSQFGMRTHPITGVYKLHSGVDIGAPYGSNFIAAADGIVASASYNTAYGNMVIINHGSGLSTLYAHGSQIVAKKGQVVKKGDVILKVGDTGYATGAHAHFEVRVNGEYKNPMDYFKNSSNNSSNTTNTTENAINIVTPNGTR